MLQSLDQLLLLGSRYRCRAACSSRSAITGELPLATSNSSPPTWEPSANSRRSRCKVSQAVAGAVVGYALTIGGFVAKAPEKPDSALTAIRGVVGLGPAIFALLGGRDLPRLSPHRCALPRNRQRAPCPPRHSRPEGCRCRIRRCHGTNQGTVKLIDAEGSYHSLWSGDRTEILHRLKVWRRTMLRQRISIIGALLRQARGGMRLTWMDFSPSARCIVLSGRTDKSDRSRSATALGHTRVPIKIMIRLRARAKPIHQQIAPGGST
jgi:hypothetical protein